jgi:hypothetical protein
MSFMALANVEINENQTQSWTATWSGPTWPQWPGIVVIQAQVVTTGISLTCSTPSVSSAPNGEYSFSFTVTNSSSSIGWYNLWIESSL